MSAENYFNVLFLSERQARGHCNFVSVGGAFCCHAMIFLQKCYSDFELQGVPASALDNKTYQTIRSRLQV